MSKGSAGGLFPANLDGDSLRARFLPDFLPEPALFVGLVVLLLRLPFFGCYF
jgi:hypothetical protein